MRLSKSILIAVFSVGPGPARVSPAALRRIPAPWVFKAKIIDGGAGADLHLKALAIENACSPPARENL